MLIKWEPKDDDRAKLKIFIKSVGLWKKANIEGEHWTGAIKFIASQTEAWLAWIEKPFNPRSILFANKFQ